MRSGTASFLRRVLTTEARLPTSFQVAPHAFGRVEFGRVGGEPVDGRSGPGSDQGAHRRVVVGGQLVPHEHDRPAQLLVRGVAQGNVIRFAEPFLLVLAAVMYGAVVIVDTDERIRASSSARPA